jgi:hypothetical protein
MTDTLAYYKNPQFTDKKSFTNLAPGISLSLEDTAVHACHKVLMEVDDILLIVGYPQWF